MKRRLFLGALAAGMITGAVSAQSQGLDPEKLRGVVVGVPGRVVRTVDEELRRRARQTVEHYRELKEGHRGTRWQSI